MFTCKNWNRVTVLRSHYPNSCSHSRGTSYVLLFKIHNFPRFLISASLDLHRRKWRWCASLVSFYLQWDARQDVPASGFSVQEGKVLVFKVLPVIDIKICFVWLKLILSPFLCCILGNFCWLMKLPDSVLSYASLPDELVKYSLHLFYSAFYF